MQTSVDTGIVKRLKLKLDGEDPADIRKIVRHYYYLQEIRKRAGNVLRGFASNDTISESERSRNLALLVDPLEEAERVIKSALGRWAKHLPIHQQFLSRIKGIGPVLGAAFPAYLVQPGRFRSVSALWAYCGQHTEQRCTQTNRRWFPTDDLADGWITLEVEKERDWFEHTAKDKEGKTFDEEKVRAQIENRLQKQVDAGRSVSTDVEFHGAVDLELERKRLDFDERQTARIAAQFDEPEVRRKLAKLVCTGDGIETAWVAARRRKGEKARWSANLKVVCWKFGESIVKSGLYYRRLYDHFRAMEDQRRPDLTDGHRFARAKRKVIKIFLSHLLVQWYQIEGRTLDDNARAFGGPYVQDVLGHTGIFEWVPDR